MNTLSRVIEICAWFVCGIYATIPLFWLMIHPFADWWRARYRAPLKVLAPLWIVLWILGWTLSSPWLSSVLINNWWIAVLAAPCWMVSFFVYFGGKRHFTLTQVIGRTELEADRHEQLLVTTGLHAHMRHPLYFGHLCTMLGWFFLVRTGAVLGLVIFGVITGYFMIHQEDKELERRFGDAYREYRSGVPAVIPSLKRIR